MALENYTVRPISRKLGQAVSVENHYLHRPAPCSFAFGLFDGDDLAGIILYGTPSSSTLRRGLAGDQHTHNVIELTRLWIADSVPRNGESFLIGRTLKLVNKEFVVSYAEVEQGHVGYVYQATNWLYTGLSAKRTNWTIDGVDKHCQTLADKYSAAEIREKFGEQFRLVPRPRKHRYVYVRAKGARRRQLLADLRYPILPYPKG